MKKISLINFRELCNSKYTNNRSVYRTGTSYNFTNKDIGILNSINLNYFFDFRSKVEKEKNDFEYFFKKSKIKYVHLPIEGYHDDFKIIKYPSTIDYANYYINIMKYGKESFYFILKFMSEACSNNPIMYGCSAGKDRTGVFSYLLLKILGASCNDIELDYKMSGKYLLNSMELKKNINIIDINDFYCRYNTRIETIKCFEKKINIEFKGYKEYLISIGINRDIQSKIRKNWGSD